MGPPKRSRCASPGIACGIQNQCLKREPAWPWLGRGDSGQATNATPALQVTVACTLCGAGQGGTPRAGSGRNGQRDTCPPLHLPG